MNWKKWTNKLKNLFIALDIDNAKQKKALLLYYGGDRLSDIYNTLGDTAETYVAAKTLLDGYFEPNKNLTYEVYNFKKLYQNEDEPINSYVSRLRETDNRCDFHDIAREIKDQIVLHGKSEKLRRKALGDDLTLTIILECARAQELAEIQASDIEQSNGIKQLGYGKYSRKFRNRLNNSNTSAAKNNVIMNGLTDVKSVLNVVGFGLMEKLKIVR